MSGRLHPQHRRGIVGVIVLASALAPNLIRPAVAAPVCNTTPIVYTPPPMPTSQILPLAPYPSTIGISGATGTITDVNITLNDITYTFPEDLDVLLVAPDGTTRLVVMSDLGGNNGGGANSTTDVDLTFDDEAPSAAPLDTQLVSGTFRPTDDDVDITELNPTDVFPAPAPDAGSATALSVFDGLAPNGTWRLYVVDDEPGPNVSGDIGGGWCIDITTSGVSPTRRVIGDYDGDRDTDRAVYRRGAWFAEGQPTAFLGTATDIPVPGDYDGDGDTDRAVYRDGTWFTDGKPTASWGLAGDVPVPGDYDGDGDTDRAVFRPSVGGWYVEGQAPVFFGQSSDIAVPGDYNGDGDTERAVFRPAVGGWYVEGLDTVFLGLDGDIPVPGDYNGDGDLERAIFRPAGGGWYVEGLATVFLGRGGDVPVPGDYNGDGDTERAIFRPAGGGWYVEGLPTVFFGLDGDIPLPLPQAVYRRFFTS